jgi:hypothetical protein
VGRLNVAFGSSAIPADRKSYKRFSIIRYQAPNTFANTSNSVFFFLNDDNEWTISEKKTALNDYGL